MNEANQEAGAGEGGAGGGEEDAAAAAAKSPAPEVLSRARTMGWVPLEEFRGPAERWVEAEKFVQRGEEILPIVNAQNRALREELKATKARLDAATESIEALKEFNSKANRDALALERRELAVQIKEAREAGNTEVELELTEKFTEAGEAMKESLETKPKGNGNGGSNSSSAGGGESAAQSAEFQQWVSENPWFDTDEAKTDYAMGVSDRLKASNPGLSGRAFLDEVAKRVRNTFPDKAKSHSKVEGASHGNSGTGGGGNGSGKSYSDLPADAKAACDKDAKRLVGANRAFKTVADWQKHYVNVYFKS
jgi:hypothetical protein